SIVHAQRDAVLPAEVDVMQGKTAALRRLAAVGFPFALGCSDETMLQDAREHIVQEPALDFSLQGFRLDAEGSTCSKARFVHHPALHYRGVAPEAIVRASRRALNGEWRAVRAHDGSAAPLLYDATFLPVQGESYGYRARARYVVAGRRLVSDASA